MSIFVCIKLGQAHSKPSPLTWRFLLDWRWHIYLVVFWQRASSGEIGRRWNMMVQFFKVSYEDSEALLNTFTWAPDSGLRIIYSALTWISGPFQAVGVLGGSKNANPPSWGAFWFSQNLGWVGGCQQCASYSSCINLRFCIRTFRLWWMPSHDLHDIHIVCN